MSRRLKHLFFLQILLFSSFIYAEECVSEACVQSETLSIPDNNSVGVESFINVDGFSGAAGSVSFTLNVAHTYRGDLLVKLKSPAGKEIVVHNRAGGGSDNLDLNLTLSDFSGENPNGRWALHISDRAGQDVGTLNRWSLKFVPEIKIVCGDGAEFCENSTSSVIPDNNSGGVDSTITMAGFNSALDKLTFKLSISHSYRSDLSVRLISPAGTEKIVHNRTGGSADDLSVDVELSDFNGENPEGVWTLHVSDHARYDTGTLDSWSIRLSSAIVCGNSAVEGREVCDGSVTSCKTINPDYLDGDAPCKSDCSGFDEAGCRLAECGDNIVEGSETCEKNVMISCEKLNPEYSSGSAICRSDCSGWDEMMCRSRECGNSELEAGETCEKGQKKLCSAINSNYNGGQATCLDNCSGWDEITCHSRECGNSELEAGEICEKGQKKLCSAINSNYNDGQATCLDNCSGWDEITCHIRECGNSELEAGEICEKGQKQLCSAINSNYNDGQATCRDNCSGWDEAMCHSRQCGNSELEAGEICEKGQKKLCSAINSNYNDGQATCLDNCSGWDEAICHIRECGNSELEAGEICEKGQKKLCSTINPAYNSDGEATCKDNCSGWDETMCHSRECGNSALESGELCEKGQKELCSKINSEYDEGAAQCNDDCNSWDESMCISYECGNSMVEGDEICDGFDVLCEDLGSHYIGGTAPCSPDCRGVDISKCERVVNMQWGTPENDAGNAIAVDGQGDIYIAGNTSGSLFGNVNLGGSDIFFAKMKADGTTIWTKQIGSSGEDFIGQIAIDNAGDLLISGTVDREGGFDLFLAKYSSDGEEVLNLKWGSSDDDYAGPLTTDSDGNIFVGGWTEGVLEEHPNNGNTDVFIYKLNSAGEKIWTKTWGTAGYEYLNGMELDVNGNLYVTGSTSTGPDFNLFVAGYNGTDGENIWTKQWDSDNETLGRAIAVDNVGNIYVTGFTEASFDGNANMGGSDIFLIKLSSVGEKVWSRQIGTEGNDYGEAVEVDSDGSVYISGETDGNLFGMPNSGLKDMFLGKFSQNGEREWSANFGTSMTETGFSLLTQGNGKFYLAGKTEGAFDGYQNSGSGDFFLSILDRSEETSECGNDFVEGKEVCDGSSRLCKEIDPIYSSGEAHCNSICTGWDLTECTESICGNEKVENGEECDGGSVNSCSKISSDYTGGPAFCKPDCTWNLDSCEIKECGNNIVEAGEMCDSSGMVECSTVNPSYISGVAICNPDCTLETSSCREAVCGNNIVEAGEMCDSNGTIECSVINPSFVEGIAFCLPDCTLESGMCREAECGNNVIEPGEMCDGGGVVECSVVNPSFVEGIAICLPDCTLESGMCREAECGNNIVEAGEMCDGSIGTECSAIDPSFFDGAAICLPDCTLEMGSCEEASCGNNTIESDEVCDGGVVACSILDSSFNSGYTACESDCGSWNVSSCGL